MLLVLVAAVLSGGNLTPTRLECESADSPLGIDVSRPRLSWVVESKANGARQTAYRIRVATSTKNLAHPDLWDSGQILSDQTNDIPYSGKPLQSAERIVWDVQVWDGANRASSVSLPATWTMHLLKPQDWQAKWVGAGPRASGNEYVTFNLRKNLLFSQKPVRALAFVCGLGQYEMSLNGTRIGEDWLSPSWTQYQKTCIADVYDVTPQLRRGPNTVELLIGNGMYNMDGDTRGGQQRSAVGDLKAICQLRLEYADGRLETIGTDSTWQWRPTPTTYSGVFGGEDSASTFFKNPAWSQAVLMNPPTGTLRGFTHAGPPLRTIEVRNPLTITNPKPNVIVLDLGQNAPYIPEVSVRGERGCTISLWPAEQLDQKGLADQRTMRPGKHVTYTLGGHEETWHPAFWYCGSRYWQVEATGADHQPIDPRTVLESFRGLMVYSSAKPVGEFECSNDLLNRIHNMIRWSIRSNLSHVITDCPHREKSGWLEQDHLMGPGLMYTYDMRRLFAKTVADMEDAQHPDGRVPTMAPEFFYYADGFADSVEWGASIGLLPKLMAEWYADTSTIEQARPALRRYVNYLTTKAKDGILSNGLGDWNGGGADPRTPVALTDTAYYYLLCKVLGETDSLKTARQIRDAFNAKFLDPATGKFATGSQSCQATALDLGLVPDGVRKAAFDRLLEDVAAQGYVVSCGEVGHPALLHVLADGNRSDLVAKIHLQTGKPGYGFMLAKGLTTLAESWDAEPISQNHFMLGQLLEWEYADLVGLKPGPDGPGFKHALIRPTPVAGITWAKASYDSCRGPFKVSWQRDAKNFILDVTIPANCTATVTLPSGRVTEAQSGTHRYTELATHA